MTNKPNLSNADRSALIEQLSARFGANPDRWPDDRCAPLRDTQNGKIVLTDAERRTCGEAAALDRLLEVGHRSSATSHDVSALQAEILRQTLPAATANARGQTTSAVTQNATAKVSPTHQREPIDWRHGVALAAALLVGVFAGAGGFVSGVPSMLENAPTTLALIDIDDGILSDEEELL